MATMATMTITSADQLPRVLRLRLKTSDTLGRGLLHHCRSSGLLGRVQRDVVHHLLGHSIAQRSCRFLHSIAQRSCRFSSLHGFFLFLFSICPFGCCIRIRCSCQIVSDHALPLPIATAQNYVWKKKRPRVLLLVSAKKKKEAAAVAAADTRSRGTESTAAIQKAEGSTTAAAMTKLGDDSKATTTTTTTTMKMMACCGGAEKPLTAPAKRPAFQSVENRKMSTATQEEAGKIQRRVGE